MDLYEIIQTLHDERKRLDRIIRRIQELQRSEYASRKPRPGSVPGAAPRRARERASLTTPSR